MRSLQVLVVLILVLFFAQDREITLSQSSPQYVFGLVRSDKITGEAYLYGIDPDQANQEIQILRLPIESDFELYQSTPSPDGKWLILQSQAINSTTARIQLLNVMSGQIQDIAEGIELFDSTLEEHPVWSPDSKKFVFQISFPDREPSDFNPDNTFRTFLYSIEENNFGPLRLSSITANQIEWSQDSQKLAIVSGKTRIHIFNPDALYSEYFFGPTLSNEDISATSIVDIDWSPNGRYISFKKIFGQFSSSEISVWDTDQDNVTQVTQFLDDPNDANSIAFASVQDTFWLTSDKLVVGAYHAQIEFGVGVLSDTLISDTVIYDVTTTATTSLSSEALLNLTFQSDNELLAYVYQEVTTTTEGFVDESISYQNLQTQISRIQQESIDETTSYPVGCDFDWSLDGNYLSYGNIILNNMYSPVHSCREVNVIYFVNLNTHAISSYSISTTDSEQVLLVGWLTN